MTLRIFSIALLASSLVVGCECSANVGSNDGGRTDARVSPPRTDECGNGLDDDHDGRIDESCPCAPGETQPCFDGAIASNGVGRCTGGTQTCPSGTGIEWGDWGAGACTGQVGPVAEACDGTDADCDGAIDEGCPCTEGATHACGTEFIVAPCTDGTQTCRGGTWSACEGAIGPSADVCDDDVDNDCDGTVNEGCTCASPPSPEQCGDGVDNDCDGTVDEPECTPDWLEDAGVREDAGCSGTVCPLAPRPLAPLSTSTVTSRRPTLRWELPAGADGARVELCADRACTTSIGTLDGVTSARPASDLPTGWVFWRLRARAGAQLAVVTGPTWQFWVGARSADGDRDTSWGSTLDLDGDGFADLAVGEPGHDEPTRLDVGRVLVFRGSSSGLASSPSWTLGLTTELPEQGRTVLPVGDLDGDGFGELATTSTAYPIVVEIFRGGPSGPTPGAVFRTTSPDVLVEGAIAALGDVDGDGYADLALGHGAATSFVTIHRGSSTGPSLTPSWTLMPGPSEMGFGFVLGDAGDVDADGFGDLTVSSGVLPGPIGRVTLFRGSPSGPVRATAIDGVANDQIGRSVSGGCDVDGDGYADVVIAAPGGYFGVAGVVTLQRGSATGWASAPTTIGTGATPTASFSDHYGYVVSCAHDLNADGFSDVVLSIENATTSAGMIAGRVEVRTGGPTGPSLVATLDGASAGGAFGLAVALAGDVDGDRHADLAVGSIETVAGISHAGRAYVFSGSSLAASWSASWMHEGSAADDHFGFSVGRPRTP